MRSFKTLGKKRYKWEKYLKPKQFYINKLIKQSSIFNKITYQEALLILEKNGLNDLFELSDKFYAELDKHIFDIVNKYSSRWELNKNNTFLSVMINGNKKLRGKK